MSKCAKPTRVLRVTSALLLAVAFFGVSCSTLRSRDGMSNERHDLFDLPLQKQHEEFMKLPIEEQFKVYVYAMTKRHPPDLSFAEDIASRGPTIIPFLLGKLKEEPRESVQQKIILIFEMMTWRHKLDLSENGELITTLNRVISSMSDPLYRDRSQNSLRVILTRPAN